ncbi:twin-arginine translocase TatA/TatE family subunit [Desulfuribacillus alkaliarsenatis]|uniref:Sec-independent protein translocase protein TatA n=1 Tax=Desulfuribacillus alkaliarsenatis TaxID=766136 RepID=A0A1E5G247_9FIRM|nr:twin-arginine translocase TatA/TatE family subunit [Desulfuribacillus alkaliarsenatis]OEF96977.1 hypothetical protein BHF68_05065 [Desulfuribacillus alkaliarsenatis]
MIGNIGVPGLILILVIALIVFGPNKLPELGRAVGRTLKEFKGATKDLTSSLDDEDEKPRPKKKVVKEEETVVEAKEDTNEQK